MTVHAFVDESERRGCYFLCAAIIDIRQLINLRKQVSGLLLPGQRELHFKKEKPQRQRMIADQIGALPIKVRLYRAGTAGGHPEQARQRCVARLIRDLCELRALRLVLDTRNGRNRHDLETIHKTFGDHSWRDEMSYEHLNSRCDPLLWIPDTAAWCYGAGGDWRRRIMPIITEFIEV